MTVQNASVVNTLPPGAIVDNTDWTFTAIDMQGYGSCLILLTLGATDIAMAALKLTECDTSGGSYTDVPSADFAATLPSATDDNKVVAWYVTMTGNRKRFLKPAATAGNGSLGTYLSGVALRGDPINGMATATDRGLLLQAIV